MCFQECPVFTTIKGGAAVGKEEVEEKEEKEEIGLWIMWTATTLELLVEIFRV